MNKYKIDTHVHTSETSSCGKVPANKILRLYKNGDYNGIVITDHYYKGFFERLGMQSWNEKVDKFLKGFFNAKKEGKKLGIDVFLGMEITFESVKNDYLVYGIDEHFLYNNKKLYELGIEKFKAFVKDKNILVYQAHPYRSPCIPADPEYLDGVEVYNGNQRHDSNNHCSLEFAKKFNLKMISGSDFHRSEDFGRGGIILPNSPKKYSTFVKMLNSNMNFELIEGSL